MRFKWILIQAISMTLGILLIGCATILNNTAIDNNTDYGSRMQEQRWDVDTSRWDLPVLDTARSVSYLSSFEKDIVLALNMVRSNPKRYAEEIVKPVLSYYEDTLWRLPGDIPIQTIEGLAPAEELYYFLMLIEPLSILQPEEGLSKSATNHALDQKMNGGVGHKGSDFSEFWERIHRYGNFYTTAEENIAYNSNSGHFSILGLLIDDGVSDRGHRQTILESKLNFVGVAEEDHLKYNNCVVINFADFFVGKNEDGTIGPVPDLSGWDMNNVGTGMFADYLTDEEKEYIKAFNMLRTDPVRYANQIVLPLLEYSFEGVFCNYGGNFLPFSHQLEKMANSMKEMEPIDPLYPSIGLSKATKLYTNKLIKNQIDSSNNNIYIDLLKPFGTFVETLHIAVAPSSIRNPHQYIINTIVSTSRARNIVDLDYAYLNEGNNKIGIAITDYQ